MKTARIVYIILIFILGIFGLQNCTLSRGFDALEVHNYFQAKKSFEKAEKRHPVAAKYGLSLIQQKNNNPFYNTDSAYLNITYVVANYDSLKSKKKEKYEVLGVDSQSVNNQQHLVANDMYQRALAENTESGFQAFVRKNPTSVWVSSAVKKRDSLSFEKASVFNSANSYQKFIERYPNSSYYPEAYKRLQRQQYVEHTADDELKNYISFLTEYPDNPFVIDAENQIYKIETEDRSVASFESFINRHPKNRYIRAAWGQMYDAYLTENLTDSAISDFIKKFPDNPFKNQIESDLALSKTKFYPVQRNGSWGFRSEEGKYVIDDSYDYAESFSEGLALVVKDNKAGFITKTGKLKIDFMFDDALPFSEGCAVVEINEKYGLINRQGEFIISPELDFLGNLKNGLIPFEKGNKYGYFDKKGQVKITPIFDEAYNFEDSLARVSVDNQWGVINTKGQYVFNPIYQFIMPLKNEVFAFEQGGKWGALNVKKDTVIEFLFDDIAEPAEGVYMVTKNDSFNYVNHQRDFLLQNGWQPVYPDYKILARYKNQPILVIEENGYNFIEVSGKSIFKTAKADLGIYSELIAFENNKLWGYLSPKPAKEVIEPIFDKAFSFEYGYGIVSLSPLWGTINRKGDFVIKAYYEDLRFLTEHIILAKGKGNYGLLNEVGDTILPFSNLKIEPFAENIVKVSNEGNVNYYNFMSNTWIRKED